jgi:hypothetical protein
MEDSPLIGMAGGDGGITGSEPIVLKMGKKCKVK